MKKSKGLIIKNPRDSKKIIKDGITVRDHTTTELAFVKCLTRISVLNLPDFFWKKNQYLNNNLDNPINKSNF